MPEHVESHTYINYHSHRKKCTCLYSENPCHRNTQLSRFQSSKTCPYAEYSLTGLNMRLVSVKTHEVGLEFSRSIPLLPREQNYLTELTVLLRLLIPLRESAFRTLGD